MGFLVAWLQVLLLTLKPRKPNPPTPWGKPSVTLTPNPSVTLTPNPSVTLTPLFRLPLGEGREGKQEREAEKLFISEVGFQSLWTCRREVYPQRFMVYLLTFQTSSKVSKRVPLLTKK